MQDAAISARTADAIVVRSFGSPQDAAIEPWPVPAVAADEVRVRVHSAGVSFVDVLTIAGRYQTKPDLPYVPGSEFSGEILEVGSAVAGLKRGDRVCGGNLRGIFATEIVVPARRVQKLPDGVSMAEAAVLRASYLTAWYALIERGALRAGETVVILGAAGAVGIAACQVARHFGATVIASASTPEKQDFTSRNGAHHTVDANAADWRDQVNAMTGGRGIDVVLDTVGGDASERAFRSLAWKGRQLAVGFASGDIPKLPINLALLKGAALVGVNAGPFETHEFERSQEIRREIMSAFAAGALRPQIGAIFPLRDFAQAMELAASGRALGRVLIDMRD